MNLIPGVKTLKETGGYLQIKTVNADFGSIPPCLHSAVKKLPLDDSGVKIAFDIAQTDGEGYEIIINNDEIAVKAGSVAGAFYAVQTLRQIFGTKEIPCLYIKDYPDFSYRGFYHDVTRGKVPTVNEVKRLIDLMALLKLNSLQLYVEHTFEFKQCRNLNEKKGCFTVDEIREIDSYCKENFIEFIPSIATFGHLFELLNQEEYKHLSVLSDYRASENFWDDRMTHHTINPEKPESIELIKSLIDQYYPLFETDYFNICCDETFDLKALGDDTGKIYVEFVKKIVEHLKANNKKVMMWADIVLQHLKVISEIPDDTCFLNWDYSKVPVKFKVKLFFKSGKKQIVCPSTVSWSRFCENTSINISNISLMAKYGKKYGALGVLNTNWGDWGNPCSLENATYGLTVGAEKSWSVKTKIDKHFDESINKLIYGCSVGAQCVKAVSHFHRHLKWNDFVTYYYEIKNNKKKHPFYTKNQILKIQREYTAVVSKINSYHWVNKNYKQELVCAAKAICLVAELCGKKANYGLKNKIDCDEFIKEYSQLWLKKNKKSELNEIVKIFEWMNS